METTIANLTRINPVRQSGRSTRMMQQAIEAAESGPVIVIVPSWEKYVPYLKRLFPEIEARAINLKFLSMNDRQFDRDSMTVLRFDGRVFFDHTCYER